MDYSPYRSGSKVFTEIALCHMQIMEKAGLRGEERWEQRPKSCGEGKSLTVDDWTLKPF
jgi:hypothetical protein